MKSFVEESHKPDFYQIHLPPEIYKKLDTLGLLDKNFQQGTLLIEEENSVNVPCTISIHYKPAIKKDELNVVIIKIQTSKCDFLFGFSDQIYAIYALDVKDEKVEKDTKNFANNVDNNSDEHRRLLTPRIIERACELLDKFEVPSQKWLCRYL